MRFPGVVNAVWLLLVNVGVIAIIPVLAAALVDPTPLGTNKKVVFSNTTSLHLKKAAPIICFAKIFSFPEKVQNRSNMPIIEASKSQN